MSTPEKGLKTSTPASPEESSLSPRRQHSFSALGDHDYSKASPQPAQCDVEDDDEDSPVQDHWLQSAFKIAVLVVVVFGVPYLCRNYGLSSSARCVVLIISVLCLNLAEVMPLYCTALFIPVLGTWCQVLGTSRDLVATSTLLVGNIFNNISFLVLGSLVINGIFVKCQLERRLMAFLVEHYSPESKQFLLFLLLGGMAMCSVLYSGSLVLVSALRPVISPVDGKDVLPPAIAKRLLLGVAFCANAGSVWLPISSPVNLITVALLREFEHEIGLWEWVSVAIPVSTIAVLILWVVMLYLFPNPAESSPGGSVEAITDPKALAAIEESQRLTAKELQDQLASSVELTWTHYFFIFVSVATLLSITIFMPYLQPIVGHAACISLFIVVLTFSHFMTREEFLQLDWDLLMLVGGTNVMAFLVRETGLGAHLSAKLLSSEFFTMLPYWGLLMVILVGTVMISTTVGHTLTGVILLPLVVALGLKLQAAETTALLCAVAIPFGMGFPYSSFDNAISYTESRKYGRPKMVLTQRDFRLPGFAVTFVALVLMLFVGFPVCVMNYGLPPPVVVSEVSEAPEKLQPKVVTENRPDAAEEVSYNKRMVNWKTFLAKPDKKAFAVGELKEGLKTRPWAASWNHETQAEADKAALDECERLADKCRLIWPQKDEDVGKGADDLRKVVRKEKKDGPVNMDSKHDAVGKNVRQHSMLRSRPRLTRRSKNGDAALTTDPRVRVTRVPITCGPRSSNATCLWDA